MRPVRIIGGQWKRTPLLVLERRGLRPTPDRVRETVFNWLNHLFDGQWERIAAWICSPAPARSALKRPAAAQAA